MVRGARRARAAAPRRAARPLGAPRRPFHLAGLVPAPGALARHTAAVAACVERIAAGELFQANVTLRLEGRLRGSAADAFVAAAAELEPRHGAFLGLGGDRAVLSFSPELFLRRSGDVVTTSPIKGTAPREAGAEALLASAKDAAEHVMIVDLSRNDLGRVAAYGSVAPGAPRRAASRPVAPRHRRFRARARGHDGRRPVRAAFPPGSVTGAPKIQALKVIADLEGSQREVYTGAIGFASPHAGLELNVAIRTLETAGGRAWLGCGGGIVADSDPHAELQEALGKAAPIARALGARVPDPPPPAPPAPRLPPWPRRPDPAAGLLETIAVRDGEPIDAAEPSGAPARKRPRAVRARAARRACPASRPTGRLRVLLDPGGAVTLEAVAGALRETEVALAAARAGGRPRHAQVARPPAGVRLAGRRPGRRRARGRLGQRVDRGRRRDARHAARRRAHPARGHPRAAAGRAAHPHARVPDRARRAGARGGDRAHLLAPARHPRRAAPPAERRGAGTRRPPARRPRNLHENGLVHSLIQAHAHCWA